MLRDRSEVSPQRFVCKAWDWVKGKRTTRSRRRSRSPALGWGLEAPAERALGLNLAGASGEELWAGEAPLTAKGRATARMSAWAKAKELAWAKAKELTWESETAGEAANRSRK
jgi:hypothetical protein